MAATPYTARTAWARHLALPVRDFLNTESGSALVRHCAICEHGAGLPGCPTARLPDLLVQP